MKKSAKRILTLMLVALFSITLLAGCNPSNGDTTTAPPGNTATQPADGTVPPADDYVPPADPIQFSITYSDNPTLPFKNDWLSVTKAQEIFNVKATFEVYPTADYGTKTIAELQTGTNIDVMLYMNPVAGEQAALALDGAIAPISDYVDMGWAPNFQRLIQEFGLQGELDNLRLSDGKYYFLPGMHDKQFYDGGLILREDLLNQFGMSAPKTYDDLYEYLKKCKENDPSSYPLTILVGPRVHYRMTMPSFGVSLGQNSSTDTWVLSWDYSKQEYFAGAISDQYKSYLQFMAKLYSEGLLDPEFFPEGDMWATKMATGAATATYAYYDQIGGVIASSEIDGIKLNLYPPLEGTSGAHHQPKSRLKNGIIFTAAAQKRADFEDLVRAVDRMFFSDEAAELWCLGVEGVTFTKNGDQIEFSDDAKNAPDGVYKYLQVQYGLGADPLQLVWINAREMTKYDENYAQINAAVASMPDAIQPVPPGPLFNESQAEEAGLYKAAITDAFDTWANDFITGAKSVDSDWDAYVTEMKNKNIETMTDLYNSAKR